jgi:hypothetical protein
VLGSVSREQNTRSQLIVVPSSLSLAGAWTQAALRRQGVMIPIKSNKSETPPGGASGV